MTSEEIRALAQAHWEYTEKVMQLCGVKPTEREAFLYIEAAIHFYKHGQEEVMNLWRGLLRSAPSTGC